MRTLFLTLVTIILFLAGCTGKIAQTEVKDALNKSLPSPEIQPSLPRPQITSSSKAVETPKVNTSVEVNVTKAPEPPPQIEQNETQEPKTYYVNVVQGIGVHEIS